MSWIEDKNVTEDIYDDMVNTINDQKFQIDFLLNRVNQMLCAESDVVRKHVRDTLSNHQQHVTGVVINGGVDCG